MGSEVSNLADLRNASDLVLNVRELFAAPTAGSDGHRLFGGAFLRAAGPIGPCAERIVDTGEGWACCFLRIAPGSKVAIAISLDGAYTLKSCVSGGWLLQAEDPLAPLLWIPQAAVRRVISAAGHITRETLSWPTALECGALRTVVRLDVPRAGEVFDLTICQLDPAVHHWRAELECLKPVEIRPAFVYGSHSSYARPADFYLQCIHGHIYNTQFIWPRNRKIADELDAYALYQILSGLALTTGKQLYEVMKRQALCAALTRQRADGGWYHGEWTEEMECHVRLHCGGMLLLAMAFEEYRDPAIAEALLRAADFLCTLTDETALGTWFLHDGLEMSERTQSLAPFPWVRSTRLGKSPSNMLVLNTHLDALVVLDRVRELTGVTKYDEVIASGRRATAGFLALRPCDAVYRMFEKLLALTWLPPQRGRRLPLPQRALKRIAWKYVVPAFHHFRSRYPRIVMPGGFIDRAINLRGVSDSYLTVNLWDLIRYRRRFGGNEAGEAVRRGIAFLRRSTLPEYWQSRGAKGHALGFGVEALWHLCMQDREMPTRQWLAEAMLACHAGGFGLPPAVLGTNPEAVPAAERVPVPFATADARLLLANLSCGARREVVIVNPASIDLPLPADTDGVPGQQWFAGGQAVAGLPDHVPAGGWLCGRWRIDASLSIGEAG